MLAALADGAGGDAGRRAVEELAASVGRDAWVSVEELAEAAGEPAWRDAVRQWGDRLAELLAEDPSAAAAVARAMERNAPGSTAAWYEGDHLDFRGGVFLREVVGVQIVIQQGVSAVPETPFHLPPRRIGFCGRKAELAALEEALTPVGPRSVRLPLVAAVSGLGGIGKTALAVEAAYRAYDSGFFPGGVLFVDLHGYDPAPLSADQALHSVLRALGIGPEDIPATADERSALYRSVLAERARSRKAVLIVADNASAPGQVRPLLPGDAPHRVLVTSRNRLPHMEARLIAMGELSPLEAYELLELALRLAHPNDTRIADEADAAERLASLCGHLPLAVQIAAAMLTVNQGRSVAELVYELADSHDRLEHLTYGDRSVRAVFDLSYRRLPGEQARLLRLLALAPGPEVSDEVVAALVGAEQPPTQELDALRDTHLVERGSGRTRWRLHDLVREFAAGMAVRDPVLREEGDAARERVLDFYCQRADAADDWVRAVPGNPDPERFATREQAFAWLDGEHAGLVAAVGWAREGRFTRQAVRLAQYLGQYLAQRRHFDDEIAVAETAWETADLHGEGTGNLATFFGCALLEVGRAEEAIQMHTRARDLFHTRGDFHGEAVAWTNLGAALGEADRRVAALHAHTRAAELFSALGDLRSEAAAYTNIGVTVQEFGHHEAAIKAHTLARVIFQAIGDRRSEAGALTNLSIGLREVGRVDEAIELCRKSLEMRRESDDFYGEARTLSNLALAHEAAHHHTEARSAYLQSADAYTRANAPTEAAEARARAEAISADGSPTDKPTPASPPAHKPASAQPSPPPPGAPGTAEP
ncbi:hypothetical protein GCM10018783_33290 [Streptomyces griseosporeus]|nr:hypothetical protein GCM10018783_33290 [Streptomyces griseosporeus]